MCEHETMQEDSDLAECEKEDGFMVDFETMPPVWTDRSRIDAMQHCHTIDPSLPSEAELLMPLARRTASYASRRVPHNNLTEDIYSASYLGLVEGLASKSLPQDEGRIPYLVRSIQYTVNNCIADNQLIRVSHKSKKRMLEQGKPLPKAVSIEDWDTEAPEDILTHEVLEALLTEEEYRIIVEIEAGTKVKDVAVLLKTNTGALWRKQEVIRNKVREWLNA